MTRYAVVDTETTGLDPKESALLEVAAVREDGSFAQSLVNPGDRRISFGAMATHHITPEMVADAPSAVEAVWEVIGGPHRDNCGICAGSGIIDTQDGPDDCHCDEKTPDVLVFHHAEFDRGFLPEYLRDLPYICTWRCAMHLYPSAESHSNGALWYELGLSRPMPPEAGHMPHRALFDALMTRDILEWMICKVNISEDGYQMQGPPEFLREFAMEQLVRLTSTPVLLTKCRFGKHRDTHWEDIPSAYMEWVLGQDFDEDTKHTCRHWLRERGRMRPSVAPSGEDRQ